MLVMVMMDGGKEGGEVMDGGEDGSKDGSENGVDDGGCGGGEVMGVNEALCDRWTDRPMGIDDCRVAFMTENNINLIFNCLNI